MPVRLGKATASKGWKVRRERAWCQGPGESRGWRAGKEPPPAGPGSGPGWRESGSVARLSLRGLDGGVSEKEGCQDNTEDLDLNPGKGDGNGS